MKNLNLLFNKTYYEALGDGRFANSLKKHNDAILNARFSESDYQPLPVAKQTFLMKVQHPGLLVGLGYAHSAGKIDDDQVGTRELVDSEVSVGFSFDYVSGQPYLPGSSVKGILRSYFRNSPQVISALTGLDDRAVKRLEREIFEYSDVFFDAVVYDGDDYGKLIGDDYITPHQSPTEDPVPIRILRVLPGVRFEFRFALHGDEQQIDGKMKLFKQLITLFGVGAKTSVGYGRMEEADGIRRPKLIEKPKTDAPAAARTLPQQDNRNFAICNACGTKNFRCKPNSREQWPSWPNCRKCGRRL